MTTNPHVEVIDRMFVPFGFLTNVFTSVPKLENLIALVIGLCISPNHTIQGISELFRGWKNQSSFNRFLTESNWDLKLFRVAFIRWLQGFLATTNNQIYFIIDDSKSEKTGSLIEKVSKDFDHNTKKIILCHTIVTALIKIGNIELPFDLRLYDKTKRHNVKSKLDLAICQIQQFASSVWKDQKPIFLFDSWYCAVKLIKQLPTGAGYVSRLRQNRLVKLDGFWYPAHELTRWVKSWDFKRVKLENGLIVWACSVRKEVKGLGEVTIVLTKHSKYARRIEFFVSNLDVPAKTILDHYSKRWSIEVFFRTAKQNLGLDAYQMRKFNGIRRYWAIESLTFSVLSILKLSWKRSCKTIGNVISKLKKSLQNHGSDLAGAVTLYVRRKFAKV